jgi:hypothetical protein
MLTMWTYKIVARNIDTGHIDVSHMDPSQIDSWQMDADGGLVFAQDIDV